MIGIVRYVTQVVSYVFRFASVDVVMPLHQAWKEIEDPKMNEEIKTIIKKYHFDSLKFSWRVFWNLVLFCNLINFILANLFMAKDNLQANTAKFIIPCKIIIVFLIKWTTRRHDGAYKYVFPMFILFFGFALTYENSLFKEYKLYEIWLIFYFFWILIWITIWFDWKRIVLAFWIVKIVYIIVMQNTYGSLGFQFYIGISYICMIYPIMSLIITKKIL